MKLSRSANKFCEFCAESGGVIEDAVGMSQVAKINKKKSFN